MNLVSSSLLFKVKKVVKTTTTRTVIPSVSDTLSLDGGGSVTGMGGYPAPMVYRQGPAPGVPMDYPTHTVPRNYHYGPPGGYDDYRTGPPSETYASLNRGARMDDRYRFVSSADLGFKPVEAEIYLVVLTLTLTLSCLTRPVHPDGYRTLDPSYRAHSRNQLDPYAAQPQVCSTITVSLALIDA